MKEIKKKMIIKELILIPIVIVLVSCGDLVNEPTQNPGSEDKKTETPKEPQKPETPPEKPKTPSENIFDEMCEAERQWAFTSHLIDLNQLKLFKTRNFAPVYNTPGVRQSGIDGWVACQKSLEMNGFIPGSNALNDVSDSEEPVVVSNVPNTEDNPTEPASETIAAAKIPMSPPERKPSETPVSPSKTFDDCHKLNRLCEEERNYLLKIGSIDLNQHLMFKKRNFAPVYNIPGQRDSGVESWCACKEALKINGFLA